MIKINFFKSNDLITAFEACGHSMSAPSGEDIICAFVSSACLMTANTITEVVGIECETEMQDGYLKVVVNHSLELVQDILKGLILHLTELSNDYPNNIKVIISEV